MIFLTVAILVRAIVIMALLVRRTANCEVHKSFHGREGHTEQGVGVRQCTHTMVLYIRRCLVLATDCKLFNECHVLRLTYLRSKFDLREHSLANSFIELRNAIWKYIYIYYGKIFI